MYTLGIETSCDETSAAVVENCTRIRSLVVSSSLNFHKKYGGIIPEIAFRKQLETISGVVDCAVKEAGIESNRIDVVGVTEDPGLLGSLLVGTSFAKAASFGLDVPLIGVNHLHGHIYAAFFAKQPPQFPCVALVVSGGHTSLFYVKNFDILLPLGATLDDACGESFDKVAKILGLGYPGGPLIEQKARAGDPDAIPLDCSAAKNPLDFSFSGIKTAVLYYARKHLDTSKKKEKCIADICASFQATVIDVLAEKALCACKMKKARQLIVCGGVAANSALREVFYQKLEQENGYQCFFPSKELCTDNAAMIGGLAGQLYKKRGKRNGRKNGH